MKNLFYFFFIILLVSSCSESDDILLPDDNKDDNKKDSPVSVKIKLNVDKTEGNIFEAMIFNFFSETDFTILDLEETYDSIIWKASDISGSLKILEYGDSWSNFTFKWSHNFSLPGDYKAYLFGYKDNEIICADSVSVNISNKKDFLAYDWKDITTSAQFSTGYNNTLTKEYSFATYYSIVENVPYIKLFLHNESKEDEISFAKRSEKILSDYISTLYSPPAYNINDDSFSDQYNQLFKYKKDNSHPQSIWITPLSNIVLFKCYEEYGDYYTYEIHAEQRNLSANDVTD